MVFSLRDGVRLPAGAVVQPGQVRHRPVLQLDLRHRLPAPPREAIKYFPGASAGTASENVHPNSLA